MKTTTKLFAIVALFATVLFASCKKEETANPVASFTISPNDSINENETFTFTNTSSDADSYLWSFGDGTTSNVASPTKSYEGFEEERCIETFVITLTATKDGKTSTTTKNVWVGFCR